MSTLLLPPFFGSIKVGKLAENTSAVAPPFIRPPLGNGKSGLIKGVASCEGYIKYKCTGVVPRYHGLIRGVASGEGGHI